jgi:hypothetical protein
MQISKYVTFCNTFSKNSAYSFQTSETYINKSTEKFSSLHIMMTMFPECHTAPHLSYSDGCKVMWEKFSLSNAKEDILPLFSDFILDATTFTLVDIPFF